MTHAVPPSFLQRPALAIDVGVDAPDFSLPATGGGEVRLGGDISQTIIHTSLVCVN